MIDDAALIAFLRDNPGQSLKELCRHFDVPYERTGHGHYTAGAKAIRNQLQRLRRARVVRHEGAKWGMW